MPVPEHLETALARGDMNAIEDDWLDKLEDPATPLDYFLDVADEIVEHDPDSARFLLELLDENLGDAGRWGRRLGMLRRHGQVLLSPEALHPTILETIEARYSDRPSLEALIGKVGLRKAVDDIPKTWKKVERLEALLALDVGSIVHMEGKGAGRVIETNMALESFKITFESFGELRVGFNAAAKVLRRLPPGHVLRRAVEEPEALQALAKKSPSDLLRAVLESYDHPRTGAEIRRDLAGIVADKRWSSWWSTARKHPQVIVEGKGRQTYTWAASSADAEDAVWQAFEAAEPRARLDFLRRDGARDPELRRRMSEALAADGASAAQGDPGLACEIWLNLEKNGELPDDDSWSPSALIAAAGDLRFIASGVQDRPLRERCYRLVREVRETWPDDYVQLLTVETEPKALDVLAAGLSEREGAMESQIELLLSQPRRAPAAFVWLAERCAERDEWRQRNPLRLLAQFFAALRDEVAFSSYRVRLQALVETGGTVPRLLRDLSEEDAAKAAKSIERATGILDYQRKPLLTALELRFPSLRRQEVVPLYATPDAIEAKHEELKNLVENEIPANRQAIKEAREHGDLRENFEYKAARQRHEYLASRAAGLDSDLKRARPIDPGIVTGDDVVIGSRIRLAPERDGGADDHERVITILGPWNSEPEKGILSNESELAQSLLGKKRGARVEINGINYEIASIEPHE